MDEFAAAVQGTTGRHILAALRLGLPSSVVWPDHAPHWGVAAIRPSQDGLYEPSADPFPLDAGALILPIGMQAEAGGWADIVDLVAILPAAPERWWLRRRAWPILGVDHVDRAGERRSPIHLVADPLRWLRAGGEAACVVDWSFNPLLYFSGADEVRCDQPSLAVQLRRRAEECRQPAFRITTDRPGFDKLSNPAAIEAA